MNKTNTSMNYELPGLDLFDEADLFDFQLEATLAISEALDRLLEPRAIATATPGGFFGYALADVAPGLDSLN